MKVFQQLVLTLPLSPSYEEHTFVETSANWEALSWVNQWPNGSTFVVIYGDAGCGKSHLSQIWRSRSRASLIVPSDVPYLSPMEAADLNTAFIVDHYDEIEDEAWLFHFYNIMKEKKGSVMFCGRVSPGQKEFHLQDLSSRLRSVVSIHIQLPDDNLLKGLIRKLFQDRGLEATPDILKYLMNRIERSYENIHKIVREIDEYAYATQKSLTMPLVRAALIKNDF